MAYSENVKHRAYTLFLMGKNAEQIESILKPEFPKISANTIRSWAETKDTNGKNWSDSRDEVNRVTRLKIQEQTSDIRSKIKADNAMMLQAVRDAFLSDAGAMIGQAKDPVSLGYLWKALANHQMQMENEDSGSIDLLHAAGTLIELFMRCPKTKKAMSDEWETHKTNLSKWHADWTNVKDVEGSVVEEPKALIEKKS
ncbi:hypothetical protein ACO1KB_19190 [Leptospira interrogans serovar Szwajizak]|uniref:hypothetical protein n=1 Tax=Leptospira interrogans TaxID=173 RepID=UPI000344977C|nr:hypothetical protein [Leptospira interrogans]